MNELRIKLNTMISVNGIFFKELTDKLNSDNYLRMRLSDELQTCSAPSIGCWSVVFTAATVSVLLVFHAAVELGKRTRE